MSMNIYIYTHTIYIHIYTLYILYEDVLHTFEDVGKSSFIPVALKSLRTYVPYYFLKKLRSQVSGRFLVMELYNLT